MKHESVIFKLLPIGFVIVGDLSLLFLLLMEGRGVNVSVRVPIPETSAKHPEDAAAFSLNSLMLGRPKPTYRYSHTV
jgi:hypothetical protein